MEFKDFINKYEIVAGEPETLFPNTIGVVFNKRKIFLQEKNSGQRFSTSHFIDGEAEIDEPLLFKIFEAYFEDK